MRVLLDHQGSDYVKLQLLMHPQAVTLTKFPCHRIMLDKCPFFAAQVKHEKHKGCISTQMHSLHESKLHTLSLAPNKGSLRDTAQLHRHQSLMLWCRITDNHNLAYPCVLFEVYVVFLISFSACCSNSGSALAKQQCMLLSGQP